MHRRFVHGAVHAEDSGRIWVQDVLCLFHL
jgi:hypothetical protein